ncbi:hypothetical protein [Haliangium sp.]|uniref:hypothetical protein n=1 Tax=Haliangium sp. TaxID=2663208 RepID=UPI003D101880
MTLFRVGDLWGLYKLPVGRMVFALKRVRQRAEEMELAEIAEHAGLGIAEGQRVLNLMMHRDAGEGRGRHVPEALEADTQVDDDLAGIDGYLVSQERAYGSEPRGQAAARVRVALFPNGLGAIVHLSFVQQHSAVDALLARAKEDDLAADVALLSDLGRLLGRLTRHNQRYGEVLGIDRGTPTNAEIDAARRRCDDLLTETVAMIVTHLALNPPGDGEDGLGHFLEPILAQNEEVRLARRRRRRPGDVDPDTGEELPPIGAEPGPGEPIDDGPEDDGPVLGEQAAPGAVMSADERSASAAARS